MYLKIFGIILSFYITYPAIVFTNYVKVLYVFDFYVYICVRHIEIHRNVLTLVKVCIMRMLKRMFEDE